MIQRLLGLLLVAGCLCALQSNATSAFDSSQCPFKLPSGYALGGNARCGFISVRENRFGSSERRIELAVLVLQQTTERSRDATVFLQGGPGGGTQVAVSGFDPAVFKALAAGGDLIFFDQRGTGLSKPSLNCPETARVQAVRGDSRANLDAAYLAAYSACKQRLEASGVDLAAYNTLANAIDVDAIRDGLGYERLNLYGGSYGSLLAQRVMREAPAAVRAVILDAVVDPTRSWITQAPENQIAVFERLNQACRANAACARAIPDFSAALLEVMRNVEKEQPVIRIDGTNRDMILNAESVLEAFDTGLRIHQVALLPYVLKQALSGDYRNIARLSELTPRGRQDIAWAMYWSVACAEARPLESPTLETRTGLAASIAALSNVQAAINTCQMWQVPMDWKAAKPVRSDAPTLLLSGYFDPITPFENAERVATQLTRAYSVTFSTGGHGQLSNGSSCVLEITQRFLTDPASVPDSSCANQALAFPYI